MAPGVSVIGQFIGVMRCGFIGLPHIRTDEGIIAPPHVPFRVEIDRRGGAGRAHVAAGDLGRAGNPRLPEQERPSLRGSVCQINDRVGSV